MSKSLKIIIAILIILLLLIFAFLFNFFRSKSTESPTLPQTDSISISTPTGNVEVANFYKNSTDINKDIYYFDDAEKYNLFFDKSRNKFVLSLFISEQDNPQDIRDTAEKYFVSKLGITQAKACLLEPEVMIPFSYSPNLSGVDYGLSFCEGSIPFPSVDSNNQIR